MKIWMINHYAAPRDNAISGTRHYDLGMQLAKDNEVYVFSANNNQALNKPVDLNEKLCTEVSYGNLHFIYVKTTGYESNSIKRVISMFSFKRNIMKVALSMPEERYPDYVIASSVHPLAWEAGYSIAEHLNSRFIAEVRDIWPMTLVDTGKIRKVNPLVVYFSLLEKRALTRAEAVITLLPNSEHYLLSRGAKKVFYVPNGIDLEMFDSDVRDCNKSISEVIRKLRENFDLIIGNAGGHYLTDNMRSLVEAARICKMQNLRVAFVSIGKGTELENLKNLSNIYELDNIMFLGAYPKSAVPGFLKAVDALIVNAMDLSVQRFGTSYNRIFEYLAAEKPIIYSAPWGEGMKNLVESEAFILAKPSDPVSIVEAIVSLMKNRDHLDNSAKAHRLFVERNHTFSVLSEKLLSNLKELAD